MRSGFRRKTYACLIFPDTTAFGTQHARLIVAKDSSDSIADLCRLLQKVRHVALRLVVAVLMMVSPRSCPCGVNFLCGVRAEQEAARGAHVMS